MKKIRLRQLCSIISGATLTSRYLNSEGAREVRVVKMKNIDHKGFQVRWSKTECVHLKLSNNNKALQGDDLLFVAKGEKNTAIRVDGMPANQAVAPTNHFFILRMCGEWKNTVNPDYICWFLNNKASTYLKQNATGATIKNISKKALEELEIALPTPEKQKMIAETYQLLVEEEEVQKKLTAVKKQMLLALLNQQ